MAITITKSPSTLYPAFNDSYIEFTSNIANDYKALIEIEGLTGKQFIIYPDLNGLYTFNLKSAVRALINDNTFKDNDDSYPVNWNKTYPYGYLDIDVTITDYGDTVGTPSVHNYTFIRGVKQIGEEIHVKPYQLLHPSINGVDYNLTYFEGYPFSFEIQRPISTDNLTITNLNSSDTTSLLAMASTNTHRIYIDKATTNWTTSDFLPLTDTLNRLELKFNNVVQTNINLKKVESQCGVYIKWFNSDGGYSYFLFEEYWKESIQGKDIGFKSSNSFNNVGSLESPTTSLGRSGIKTLTLKAKLDKNESKHLESLFTSPSVQIYSKTEPYLAGEFIDVILNTDYSLSNKKSINEVIVTLELPQLITAKI